ncbi:MAG: hypothetical protein WCG31_10355, partial [Deltaproteobacteria bacterium]
NPKSVSTTTGIVFIDNSGYDLRCLSERFTSERIEWISFYDLDYPNNYHQNLFLNWSPDGRKGLMSSTRAAR